MSTTKIIYKTKKWDRESQESRKNKGLEGQYKNLEQIVETYTNPNQLSDPNDAIKEAVSFYDLLGGIYFLIASDYYLLDNNIFDFLKNIYLCILAKSLSYKHENNGIEITRKTIKKKHENKTEFDKIMFCAASIGKPELFEQYGNNLGCEIIKAMYYEDYEKAKELVSQLPDTSEIYEKEKYMASYCYESRYLKALYQAILSKDEKAFNKALADRIKFIRKGYVMPVDVVSVTMIKFARKLGMDYHFDVIEIPKALLDDLSDVPFEEYQLPEV